MFPLAITLLSSVLVFLIIYAVLGETGSKRREVEKRILELKSEQTQTKAKQVRKSKKTKGSTLARTRREMEKLENQIYDAGIRIPVAKFLGLWLGTSLGIPILLPLFGVSALISCLAAAVIAMAPIIYIGARKKKRKQALEGQLVEAISVLCNALKAGHSFQSAMNNIAQEMPAPISEEFGRVFLETQHGMTMADSFQRMVDRTGSEDLEMICTAILIQRDIGGNLAEVLENISGTINARLSLKEEIKTRTASGRLSGYIVGALPIILLIAMSVINPGYSNMLFTTDLGHTMLMIGGAMEVMGFIVINKMVSIKY